VRQALINEGKVDVHVVPGMTLPTNLFAEIALNTTQQITSITPEFPAATQLQSLGTNGPINFTKVQFSQLGENMLTINYGDNQTMYLEFCVTEPIETLFQKRAGFLVSHQQWEGVTNWFDGLFADWNENDQVQNSPINYDTISGFVIYEVAERRCRGIAARLHGREGVGLSRAKRSVGAGPLHHQFRLAAWADGRIAAQNE
jgi:hypothetical protein